MSRESNLQLKVGLFVLIAMLVLTYFIVSVTDLSFTKKGYGFQAVFGFVNGLREAAPVRLAGVEIGIVKSLTIDVDEKDKGKIRVLANMWVQEGIKIPVDSTITINQLGLLGEKYIEIIPGIATQAYKDKDVMQGKDPLSFETVTEDAVALMEKAKVTIDSINDGILTEQNKSSLAQTLSSFAEISNNIKNGHGTIGRFLVDESIFKNLDDMTADLKSNPWKLLYRPKK